MKEPNLLLVKGLSVSLRTDTEFMPVKNASIRVDRGEIVGLIGETGSGKSTLLLSLVRLLDQRVFEVKGEILLEGRDILKMERKEIREVRGSRIAMMFQDARAHLNPLMTIGEQISEAAVHQTHDKARAKAAAIDALRSVKMPSPELLYEYYPHQLSGGMCQRAFVAMSIVRNPSLLLADEPTSALDVTVQSQVLDLLAGINRNKNLSILIVTHDLGVVAEICNRIYVIKQGQIVEEGGVSSILKNPQSGYARELIESTRKIIIRSEHGG